MKSKFYYKGIVRLAVAGDYAQREESESDRFRNLCRGKVYPVR